MASIYTAGSASVQIVPDFSNAQRAIGQWFARQDDLKVRVQPDIDQAALARVQSQLQAGVGNQTTKVKVDVDRAAMAKNFVSAIDFLSGFGTIQSALTKLFDPGNIIKANLGGAAVAIGASLSQAAGSAALLPGIIAAAAVPIATLVIGTQGLGDAFSALASGDAAKVSEAMKNLSKEAGQFVRATHDLGDAWKDLRFDVQNALFDGLSEKMTTLGEKGIPVLRRGLVGIADEFNLMAGSIMDLLASDSNLADFGTVMDNIKLVIHEIALAARPLVEAFFDIATVGSEFLPGLVAGFGDLAREFADFIQAARDSGALRDFMSTALSAFGDILVIVKNLAGALGSVFSAALPAGGQLLGILKEVTGDLNAFLKTDVAQSGLATFFSGVAEAADALQPAIGALAEAVVTGILPAMGQFAAALAPVINGLLVQFADMIGELTPLLYPALADAITVLVSALAPLIPQFTNVVTTLLPPLTDLIAGLAPLVGELATAVGDALVGAVDALAPLLPDIADAIIAIAEAMLPWAKAAMELAVAILPPFVAVLQAVAKVLEFISPILPAVLAGFLAFKAVAGISTLMTGFSTALLGAAVASERVGAARLSSGLLATAGAAERAGGAVRGLAGFLGGPWGIVAAAGVGLIVSRVQEANEEFAAFKEQVLRWRMEMELGGTAGAEAAEKVDGLRAAVKAGEAQIQGLRAAAGAATGDTRGFGTAIHDAQVELERNKAALAESEAGLRQMKAELGPVGFAQALLTVAQENYNEALAKGTPREQAAALAALQGAQAEVAHQTQIANEAAKTQLDLMKEASTAILEAANSQLAYDNQMARTNEAIKAYTAIQNDATKSDDEKAQSSRDMQAEAYRAADAAAALAEKENEGKTATEKHKAVIDAQIDTLQGFADKLDGPAKQALLNTIEQLRNSATEAAATQQQMKNLGLEVVSLPSSKYIEIKAPTQQQKKDLQDLGYMVVTLPNGNILVSANTNPAQQEIQRLLNQKRIAYIEVRARMPDLNGAVSGSGRMGTYGAIGGIVKGFAMGGIELTAMSGGIAQIVKPNTWRVIGDRVRDDEAYIPINDDARSQKILAATAQQMGYSLLPTEGSAWAPPGLTSMPTSLSGGSRIRPLGGYATAPMSVAGFVNNGTVLTTDLGELSRQAKRGTQRALASAGLR